MSLPAPSTQGMQTQQHAPVRTTPATPMGSSAIQIPGMYFHGNVSLDWAAGNGPQPSLMTSLFSGKSHSGGPRCFSSDPKSLSYDDHTNTMAEEFQPFSSGMVQETDGNLATDGDARAHSIAALRLKAKEHCDAIATI
ncbi:hypothetical protein V1264_013263 [Littorina saxatilis]|uniref:OAR domain-containing protein n=2 Tax=Littorina saxatilis TaxID=31220 RepID=A0AAN9GJM5_9CAEN